MRDDREAAPSVIRQHATCLIVVRAPRGAGKTEMVRRWSARVPGTVIMWHDARSAPPSAASFWMRLITQLHSRGLISDERLFRTATVANGEGAAMRAAIGQLLAALDDPPTLIVDDLQRAVSAEIYVQVIDDIAYFLAGCPRLRVVIIESERSVVDDIDISGRITIGAEHVPPVAFLSESFAAHMSRTPRGPSLRRIVNDDRLLKAVCLAALPHSTDVELTHALTGAAGRELLDAAAEWGLGTWQSTPTDVEHFTFRATVRTEARAELRRSWPIDKIAAARRLALWYLARADRDLAFEFAVMSEDIAIISHVGLRLVPFVAPFPADVVDRLARFPIDRVRESAVLSLWAATYSNASSHPPASTTELYAAAAAAAAVQNSDADIGATEKLVLLGLESFAARRAGDAVRGAGLAKQFHARASKHLAARRIDEALLQPFVQFAYQASATLTYGDENEAAIGLLAELEKLCRAHGLEYRRSSAQAALGYHYAATGDVPKGAAFARTATAHTARGSRGSHTAFLQVSNLVRAALAADLVQLRLAVAALDDSTALASHWDLRLFGEVLLDLDTGNATAARVRVDSAVRAHARTNVPISIRRRVTYLHDMLRLFGEPPRAAAAILSRAPADAISLALGAAHDINNEDLDEASAKLGRASTRTSTPIAEHLVYVVLTRLGIAGGDIKGAHSTSEHLLLLLRAHGLRLGFALFDEQERSTILASVGDARELREAFAATTAMSSRFTSAHAPTLTRGQLTVIRALAELGDRQAVAHTLFLSPGTVKAHLRAVYKKLDAHSQAEALYKAAALGLLTTPRGHT